ncbi:MAG: hypothetical protein V3V04_05835 [Rhizobiaceae bacterium]
MTYELVGNWKGGLAFDLHTIGSVFLGVDQYGQNRFDNTHSDMGKLVYQLKYRSDKSAVPKIIELLTTLTIEGFDAIIPVPSSKARALQPVDVIAEAFGAQRGVPALIGHLTKAGNAQLKNIDDPVERTNALANISVSGKTDISGKKVLLLDDLYDSGATLGACSNVNEIWVLTMTKTRSKR